MKKLILLFLSALMLCVTVHAQKVHISIAAYDQNLETTTVYTDVGQQYEFDGKLINIGMDRENVWTLVMLQPEELGSRFFRVYKNGIREKSYKGNANKRYFSMAMKVKDGHVYIAGSRIHEYNDKGYEASLFGDIDFERSFETDLVRKSLKRENFLGFRTYVGSNVLDFPEYDRDGTDGNSVVYGVKAVDYVGGKFYATGWGEREYTQNIAGRKYYLVRRCPRVWIDGKESVQQEENKTGAAYNINVFKTKKDIKILTSGHYRGLGIGWQGNTSILSYSGPQPVEAEAVLSIVGAAFNRCCVISGSLYFACTSDKKEKLNRMENLPKGYYVRDVVADPSNMDFYVLATSMGSDKDAVVWRIHCLGTDPQKPETVCTFKNVDSDIYKLAIYR